MANLNYNIANPTVILSVPVVAADCPQSLYEIIINALRSSVQSTGVLTVATIPVADETIAVNGVTFTFKALSGSVTQITIGATKAIQAVNIATILNASTNAAINIATYEAVGDTIEITNDAPGTAGDAFTLADSSGTVAITRSAATLTGGVDSAMGASSASNADSFINNMGVHARKGTVTPTGAACRFMTKFQNTEDGSVEAGDVMTYGVAYATGVPLLIEGGVDLKYILVDAAGDFTLNFNLTF